jgi:hypothetical protein
MKETSRGYGNMKDGLAENIIYNFSRLEEKMKDNKKNNSLKTIKLFNKKFYVLTPFLFSLCLILMLPVIAWSASVTMTWNRNQEPDIAGYRIYYGTQSGQYNNTITINDSATQPLQRSYTVDGLNDGVTYYFALKTFDQAGQISNYSAEASQTIPGDGGGGTGLDSPAWISAFSYGTGWSSQDKYPRMMADVNGDGMADIVGFGYAGAYVVLSNGAGFDRPSKWIKSFAYDAGWQSQDKLPRMMADVNGDGMADIVGFGKTGVYVAFSN